MGKRYLYLVEVRSTLVKGRVQRDVFFSERTAKAFGESFLSEYYKVTMTRWAPAAWPHKGQHE